VFVTLTSLMATTRTSSHGHPADSLQGPLKVNEFSVRPLVGSNCPLLSARVRLLVGADCAPERPLPTA